MNFFVLIFGDKLKICNVVVFVIEIAVVNVVTFVNFAVKVRPNETVDADCATEIFADALVELETDEFLLRVADRFNRWHGAFDLANHFLDGERFLRRLDRLAQQLENFFRVLHAIASKILTSDHRNATMQTETPRQALG